MKTLNLNTLATSITDMEDGQKPLNIAQVKTSLKYVALAMATDPAVIGLLVNYGRKTAKKMRCAVPASFSWVKKPAKKKKALASKKVVKSKKKATRKKPAAEATAMDCAAE